MIKIDYADGTGDGHVIWRLGQGGDFAVNSSDPSPWFSHQHYPHYLDDSTLVLFDNGNTRQAGDPNAHSRGQVWKLDEDAMTATLEFNVDLGNYSGELGPPSGCRTETTSSTRGPRDRLPASSASRSRCSPTAPRLTFRRLPLVTTVRSA